MARARLDGAGLDWIAQRFRCEVPQVQDALDKVFAAFKSIFPAGVEQLADPSLLTDDERDLLLRIYLDWEQQLERPQIAMSSSADKKKGTSQGETGD